MDDSLSEKLCLIKWTPEHLKEVRESLNLRQSDIAKLIGVSQATISHVKTGYDIPALIMIYGIILERYYAYKHGYLPGFRKIGTNDFKEQ